MLDDAAGTTDFLAGAEHGDGEGGGGVVGWEGGGGVGVHGGGVGGGWVSEILEGASPV